MKSIIHKFLLSLAITMMAMATNLPGDPSTTAASVTVTVTEKACMISGLGESRVLSDEPTAGTTTVTTFVNATDCPPKPAFDVSPTGTAATVTVWEQACMTSGLGDITPLAIANALATATDVTAAASLVASLMAERLENEQHGASDPRATTGTTTVTAFADATDCPPKPTFDMTPNGEFATLYNDELTRITANTTNATDIGAHNQRNIGQTSMCITDSSVMGPGGYGVFIDGWGQDKDGCGKGILDNLRGQCWHGVDRWECQHWGSGVKLTFRISGGLEGCVTDGTWLASPHDNREYGLCCSYTGPSVIWRGKGSCSHSP